MEYKAVTTCCGQVSLSGRLLALVQPLPFSFNRPSLLLRFNFYIKTKSDTQGSHSHLSLSEGSLG